MLPAPLGALLVELPQPRAEVLLAAASEPEHVVLVEAVFLAARVAQPGEKVGVPRPAEGLGERTPHVRAAAIEAGDAAVRLARGEPPHGAGILAREAEIRRALRDPGQELWSVVL